MFTLCFLLLWLYRIFEEKHKCTNNNKNTDSHKKSQKKSMVHFSSLNLGKIILGQNKCKHGYSNMLRHDFPLSQRMLSGQSPIAGQIHKKFRGAHFTMMI